ncbi:MAG: glutamate synthase central domain-containing protein, partial [Thermodesulfobacteriota bacterium]
MSLAILNPLVMSLMTFMGNTSNILNDTPENARLIKLRSPIISNGNLVRLTKLVDKDFKAFDIPIGFNIEDGPEGLAAATDRVCKEAEKHARDHKKAILILNDADLSADVAPIPALLAVSAVNQHLARRGLRASSSIVVKTDEAREVHHIALLLAYGATAVNPN